MKKVTGVTDSYVVDVDGHRYHCNKRDLTLIPPHRTDKEREESDGDSHQDDQGSLRKAVVRPTLCPRQTLKFPRLPVQATQQKDFNL